MSIYRSAWVYCDSERPHGCADNAFPTDAEQYSILIINGGTFVFQQMIKRLMREALTEYVIEWLDELEGGCHGETAQKALKFFEKEIETDDR